MTKKTTAPSPPAPKDIQQRVAKLVSANGILKTAAELGIGRDAVTRIVGGLGVRAGTVDRVQAALEELRAADATLVIRSGGRARTTSVLRGQDHEAS